MSFKTNAHTTFGLKKIDDDLFHIVIDHPHQFVALSDTMPMLNSFGLYVLNENAHQQDALYRHIYTCQGSLPGPYFIDALEGVWNGIFEADDFNRLITVTSLSPHNINILRAYGRYLQQISFPDTLATIATTLASEPALTHLLMQCLQARFHPNEMASNSTHTEDLRLALRAVRSHVDHIFHTYLDLFAATVRMQTEGLSWVAFKLESRKLDQVPEPRPLYESFVYSPRVEGVHLRNGPLARGGIRWSEREDFRYEILELVKAQTLKNAIIVPTGAKGGFLCRKWNTLRLEGATQSELNAEKTACYELFITALLDLVDASPTSPPTPPHKEVDAYFVVAADKGTSQFSDLANRLAEERHFWLHDAFASGGSNGYDHKKMGITAKGAWVSLEHHRQLKGLDHPLSFVGVGDMSGDVFGNGLLRPVKLIAAFSHQHILIDPTPDIEASLKERQRLFELPESTWGDYNPQVLSAGGGIFERSQSQLTLTPEAAQALGVEPRTYPTHDVIRSILKANVDILWLGGIGTFVKGPDESNQDVRDRANDNVRISGHEIGASIVVEGANLGMTQAGRVTYALAGGLVNTDATDNSAGVDCSDHEVNIKIFLRHKKVPESAIRTWLEDMSEDVAQLVLQNNTQQNNALTAMEQESPTYEPLRQYLKQKGIREGVPRGLQLLERPRHHWTRPELCYLLAHMKNDLTQRIFDVLPKLDPTLFQDDIIQYFPPQMQKHFGSDLFQHPLHTSLLATILTNHIINTWGPMWALPFACLTTWLPAYHWLRSRRSPHKSDSQRWHIFLVYFQRFSHKKQTELAYQLVWGQKYRNASPTWQATWPALLSYDNTPAVWDLGAILIDATLNASDHQNTSLYLPSKTTLADLTHVILNLYGENHVEG